MSHSSELNLLLLHGVSLSNGVLVEVSLENASEDAAESCCSNIGALIDKRCLWCIWIDPLVHDSLENWLDGSNCWVDASSGNTLRGLDARVQSNSNGNSVKRNILTAIVLYNLNYESDEEESHHEFNKESLFH